MNVSTMQFRTGAPHGVRHVSGQVVFDEAFQGGRTRRIREPCDGFPNPDLEKPVLPTTKGGDEKKVPCLINVKIRLCEDCADGV
ncbi:MAG: hypothetical protein WC708_14635 [Lentisphaeria bacterium]